MSAMETELADRKIVRSMRFQTADLSALRLRQKVHKEEPKTRSGLEKDSRKIPSKESNLEDILGNAQGKVELLKNDLQRECLRVQPILVICLRLLPDNKNKKACSASSASADPWKWYAAMDVFCGDGVDVTFTQNAASLGGDC